MKYYCPKKKGN